MLSIFALIYRMFQMVFQPFYVVPLGAGQGSDNINMDQTFAQAIGSNVNDNQPANDIETMMRRLAELEDLAHQQSIQIASTPGAIKEPKINAPAPFKGNKSEAEEFILKCQSVFDICDRTYHDDRTQLAFVFNLLQGDAYQWLKPALLSHPKPEWIESWPLFKLEFAKNFADSDTKETSRQKLKTLKQSSSASVYATEFKRHALYLSWSDEALRQSFFDGLKLDVQDRLLSPQRFASFHVLVDSAIEWDNLLFQRRRAHSTARSRSTQDSYTPSKSYSSTTSKTTETAVGPWPMEVDSVQPRKPLTQAEKDERRKNNLCLYCGKPGHQVFRC
jgi:hypothetical protein